MKTKIITLSLIAALLYSYDINANTIETASEKPGKTKITQVTFENVDSGSRLLIKNRQGQTLFSESITRDGSYTSEFDFYQLPKNDYYFELDEKGFITIYPFQVHQEFVEVQHELKSTIVKPYLYQEGNKVLLQRNIFSDQELKIEIYLDGRELVFSEVIKDKDAFKKSYDFSSSASGEYLFNIYYEDRLLSESVNIQTRY